MKQQGPLVLLVCLALLLDSFFARAVTPTAAQSYDLVLTGGRVMDPESGLNGTRNIGIRAGRIAAISTTLQPNHATDCVKTPLLLRASNQQHFS